MIGGGSFCLACFWPAATAVRRTLRHLSGIRRPRRNALLSDYDANGDHKLSREELKKCPGLLSAVAHFDRDSDGAISADELKAQLQEIHEQQAALVEVHCSVSKGGRPLEGATVTFVPEPFMGNAFKPSSGVSRPDGTAFPSIPEEELPKELRGRVHGVHCGVFRVTVTHPTVAVPAKFNTQTEIGWIVLLRNHETLTINL